MCWEEVKWNEEKAKRFERINQRVKVTDIMVKMLACFLLHRPYYRPITYWHVDMGRKEGDSVDVGGLGSSWRSQQIEKDACFWCLLPWDSFVGSFHFSNENHIVAQDLRIQNFIIRNNIIRKGFMMQFYWGLIVSLSIS